MLLPNDHAKMLVDLLRASGGEGAELLRRWVAALMTAPAEERRAIVEAVEQRITELYASDAATEPLLHLESHPKPREGFTEIVVKSFTTGTARKPKPSSAERTA